MQRNKHGRPSEWRPPAHLTLWAGTRHLPQIIASVMLIPTSLALLAVLHQGGSAERFSKALQVRFDKELLASLDRIEGFARSFGITGLTRSNMVRRAVAAYLEPLIALLDQSGSLDETSREILAKPASDTAVDYDQATRVRLGDELAKNLDRIEAHARGLGYRHITRSSLVRDALRGYLKGFEKELKAGEMTTTGSRTPSEAFR